MPNPGFLPLIGSGFDSLAGQQAHWAGFNESVDEGNLARLAAAQTQRNNWLSQVNAAQRQDVARQDAAEQSRIGLLQAAAQQAESARRFDIGTGLSREQLAAENKRWTFSRDQKNEDERKLLDSIAAAGENMAPRARKAAQDWQDAAKEYQDAQTALASVVNESARGLPADGYRWDKTIGGWAPKTPAIKGGTAATPEQIQAANEKIAEARGNAAASKSAHDAAREALIALRRDAAPYQLLIGDDGSVFSPLHKTTFGKKAAPAKEGPLSDAFNTSGFEVMMGAAPILGNSTALGSSLSGFGAEPDTSTETTQAPADSAKGTIANPIRPTTQAEYDSLQPGSYYFNSVTGKVYRKH